ncbi:MAG: phosphatase PAP2 family protein [Alphaproteobacteria bacterium]|nr:phosphatase PAP2 family protein [Alphaproteobacteria bacterium]
MKVTQTWKIRIILVVLVLSFAFSEKQIERLGDTYQYALPLLALGCSLSNGEAVDFLGRYLVQLALVHGPKNLLGETDINARPRGGYKGMPSGHTATAVFGASNLVNQCIRKNVLVQIVVIAAAVFVGGSRVQSGAHNIWQVLIGAFVGWGSDRAFRRAISRRRKH